MKFCLLSVLGPLGSAEIPIQIGFLHCDHKSVNEHSRRVRRVLRSAQPLLPSLPFGHLLFPHISPTPLREIPTAIGMHIRSPRSAHCVRISPHSAPHLGKLLNLRLRFLI